MIGLKSDTSIMLQIAIVIGIIIVTIKSRNILD